MSSDIAIIGLAGRFPGAADVEEYWANLIEGRVGVREIGRAELLAAGVPADVAEDPAYVAARGVLDGVDQFDAGFFGIPPKEAELMDPQHRLLMQTAWTALESAGMVSDRPFGRVGLFAGAGFGYYLVRNVLSRREEVARRGLLPIVIANETGHLATKIAYRLRLGGPAISVQTACSTSLVAVHLACQSLRSGDADVALAGGACIALPQHSGYLHEEGGILSPDGVCRPFDRHAAGTVPGNGVGLVVLKRAEDARRDGDDVHAVIKGSAVNNDGGDKVGYTAPGVQGQIDVLRSAYRNAGVDPATVGYLEAHGAGTAAGDEIELAALIEVFGAANGHCSLGSVKANVGHLDAASGIAGLIKAASALRHRRIPPLAGLKELRPELSGDSPAFRVDVSARAWEPDGDAPRRAGVSSFGIGGTNAHIVLEEWPRDAEAGAAVEVDGGAEVDTDTDTDADRTEPGGGGDCPAVLPVSAKDPEALKEAATRLAAYLTDHPDLRVGDVALTLQSHRRAFRYRLSVAARDVPEAAELLSHAARAPRRAIERRPSPVFLFPGQGAEKPGMSAGLYRTYPAFRAPLDHGADLLRDVLGLDVRDVLVDDDPQNLIHRIDVAHPALVLHEYALGRLLESWGIRPAAMIGHSLGEFAAAALAGELDPADALRLVAHRGALAQEAPEGAMLVVFAAQDVARSLLPDGLDIAAVNAPEVVVAAGPVPGIAKLRERLGAAGIEYRPLPLQRAFHSRSMAEAAEQLHAMAARLTPRARNCDIFSAVDARLLPAGGARTSDYWSAQLRGTVRFRDAATAAAAAVAEKATANRIFVEVGPGSALTGAVNRTLGLDAWSSIPLQPGRDPDSLTEVLGGLGRLWSVGLSVDWPSARTVSPLTRPSLPTYPFARTSYWLEAESGFGAPTDPAPALTPVAPASPVVVSAPNTPPAAPTDPDLPDPAVPDADPVLTAVIEVWQSLLGGAPIDAEDDFFGRGGESLLFIRMLTRLRERFGIRLPAAKLIRTPTPRAVAAFIDDAVPGAVQTAQRW